MRDSIIDILSKLRPEFDFTADVDFIEEGMLDSFDVISLVDELENHFGIRIDGLDVLPENFSSVDGIIHLLKKNGAE
jgi:acyl carrier protein